MIRFIISYLFVWFVFSTLGGCRTPQHRNLDRVEYSPHYNLENGGFDRESTAFLSVLYILARR